MWKTLIYDQIPYKNFLINKKGQIKNQKTNHIYKPYKTKTGYLLVTLPMGQRGKVKSIRLHKAIAETFIPNPNNYPIVHHKNENKSDINITNLEWTTSQGNTHYHLKIQKTPFFNNRKLTKQNVEFIRKNKNNIPIKKLAKQFDVSTTTIRNVIYQKFYNNGLW